MKMGSYKEAIMFSKIEDAIEDIKNRKISCSS